MYTRFAVLLTTMHAGPYADDFIARVEVVLAGYGFTGDNCIGEPSSKHMGTQHPSSSSYSAQTTRYCREEQPATIRLSRTTLRHILICIIWCCSFLHPAMEQGCAHLHDAESLPPSLVALSSLFLWVACMVVRTRTAMVLWRRTLPQSFPFCSPNGASSAVQPAPTCAVMRSPPCSRTRLSLCLAHPS